MNIFDNLPPLNLFFLGPFDLRLTPDKVQVHKPKLGAFQFLSTSESEKHSLCTSLLKPFYVYKPIVSPLSPNIRAPNQTLNLPDEVDKGP